MRVWSGSIWVSVESIQSSINAAASASASASSATAASASATTAANLLDNFDDRYLGSKTANPSVDNDGNALLVGAIYWNSTATEMRVWSGSAWFSVQNTQSSIEAAASATAASTSAIAASNSATQASSSATAAASSVQEVSNLSTQTANSANSAATSATQAASFASIAENSSNTAVTSATQAINSANESAASANESAASAIQAATSATQAATSASQSATSANQASNSATIATESATQSVNSVNAVETIYNDFQNNYLGAKSTVPFTDNFGNALQIGAIYWNSNISSLYIWDGATWNAGAVSITGAVSSFNSRQGAITLSRSDIESAIPISSASVNDSLVLRDASGNFAGNIISAVDFNSTSDRSLKTNVTSLNTRDKFMELNPVEFTWKDSGRKSYGLIAQEIEEIFPELVVERVDGFKGVNYTPIIAMLISQVQELSLKLEKLSV